VNPKSLPQLLAPYRTDAIAKATGTHADTVRAWRRGNAVPALDKVEGLAQLTGLSIGELSQLLIDDIKRVRSAVA
jgi:transcriptional regulator with XRE-family HTH domain